MYATTLTRDPFATYRQIDAVGRTTTDGPGLVQLLYKELVAALRAAAWASDNRQYATKSDRGTRATATRSAPSRWSPTSAPGPRPGWPSTRRCCT